MNLSYHTIWIPHTSLYEFYKTSSFNCSKHYRWTPLSTNYTYKYLLITHTNLNNFLISPSTNYLYHSFGISHTTIYDFIILSSMISPYNSVPSTADKIGQLLSTVFLAPANSCQLGFLLFQHAVVSLIYLHASF